ncbi:REP-associated tyrosine transposase [Roseivivax sp.]
MAAACAGSAAPVARAAPDPGFVHPHLAGRTEFFTLAVAHRGSALLTEEVALLRAALREVLRRRPFHIDAFVVLPDHLHALWTLPEADDNASERWGNLKAHFSRALRRAGRAPEPPPGRLSAKARRRGEIGIWTKGFSRHRVGDRAEYEALRRACWCDPVKHGLVARAEDWPFSSLHRDRRMGEMGEV